MVDHSVFALSDRPVVITGGGGLLGQEHALAVGRVGGIPILLELSREALNVASARLDAEGIEYAALEVDLTDEDQIVDAAKEVEKQFGAVWGLVNNVASNPAMGPDAKGTDRLESFPLSQWEHDIRLGLTCAFQCGRHFGTQMAASGGGSIVNVASDLALISPDQRMYAVGVPAGTPAPVKPVSYSVVKTALLGLTRYLATYWSPIPVRCNSLVPGSVGGNQGLDLTRELTSRIPLNRLARPDEYQGALVFLLSDASAYMTGSKLVMDGGRSIW